MMKRLQFRRVIDRRPMRGQALVEMAITLPIILLLGLGAFDLGRAIFAHIALQEATQEGAIYAAYNPSDSTEIENRIITSSNAAWVTDALVTVGTPACSPEPGKVTVRSDYDLPLLTPVLRALFGPTLALGVEIDATIVGASCP